MIVCLPVKNGWQLPQTSTRSSGRVEPTVHSVPHEPQWTLASKYLGWISGFTKALLRRRPCRALAQPVVAGQSGVVYALAAAVSTASTRMRFLLLVACSNFTLPVIV